MQVYLISCDAREYQPMQLYCVAYDATGYQPTRMYTAHVRAIRRAPADVNEWSTLREAPGHQPMHEYDDGVLCAATRYQPTPTTCCDISG